MKTIPPIRTLCVAGLVELCSAIQSVSLPAIDTSSLGSMGLVGFYDSISTYSYLGQQNATISDSGASVIVQTQKNEFQVTSLSDNFRSNVSSLCTLNDDSIYFAGNQSLGLLNITTNEVSNIDLSDLEFSSGDVLSTLYCDSDADQIYVGGSFSYNKSTGVAIYTPKTKSWSSPLFRGFAENSQVNHILSISNDSIIFAGKFTQLYNSSLLTITNTSIKTNSSSSNVTIDDYTQQLLSFNTASVSAQGTKSDSNAYDLLCPGGANSSWQLDDNREGTWQAEFPFEIYPTKIRLYNLDDETDGTKTFQIIAFPGTGIMNLTYVDSTGDSKYCDYACPLAQHSDNSSYTDFDFVNSVGMTGFQIALTDYYGSSAGLSGLEIFQSNLNVYANNTLNMGYKCQALKYQSDSSLKGSGWETVTTDGVIYSSVEISSADEIDSVSAKLVPAVPSKGNFSLHLFTPGCESDGTCSQRGGVNVTVYPSSDDSSAVSTQIYQTNTFEKYDSIYNGSVDPSDGFKPYIEIKPLTPEQYPLTFVVERAQYIFRGGAENVTNSTRSSSIKEHVPVNGLFEFNLKNFTKYQANSSFSPVGNSSINLAGHKLGKNVVIRQVLSLDNSSLIVGGSFNNSGLTNVAVINGSTVESPSGMGLNAPVSIIHAVGSDGALFAGSFNATTDGKSVDGLALYNTTTSKWEENVFGSGVSGGSVLSVVNFNLAGNTSSLAISGNFTHVNGTTIQDSELAIWIEEEQKWRQWSSRVELSRMAISGNLTGQALLNNTDYYFGELEIKGTSAPGAVSLGSDFDTTPMPFSLDSSSNSLSKRASVGVVSGSGDTINCGTFANSSLSIIGGHFTAKDSNGTAFSHIGLIDQSSGASRGLSGNPFSTNSTGTVYTLLVNDDKLFAGGQFTASSNGDELSGLIFYDLSNNSMSVTQPPGLYGSSATVTTLLVRPNSNDLVAMGSFSSAGSLGCTAFCVYNLDASRWNSPASGLEGVVSTAQFIDSNTLLFSGDLVLNSTSDVYLAQYDFKSSSFSSQANMSSGLPGPVNAFALNGEGTSSMFASGTDTSSNQMYLSYWNSTHWTRIDSLFQDYSVITGVSLLELSTSHSSNSILPDNQLLMVTGNIGLRNFGNASTVLYDGLNWQPLYLTTQGSGSGTVNSFFSQSTSIFNTSTTKSYMDRGFVVLIALAIAVGLMFLIILLSLLVAYIRRRRQGYAPAPRVYEGEMAETIPPSSLIREMDQSPEGYRRPFSG